jgi:gliding motility-associated-like protein
MPTFIVFTTMKNLFLFFLFVLFFQTSFSQSSTCANAQPFCTGTTYSFPATTNATAQVGPDYGCLGTQPNPAWYYLQISAAGTLSIQIQGQQPGSTSGQDVDFVCWGPFGSLTGVCNNLTAANIEDCSYSASSTETCTIQNAIPGQFYMICITNFANVSQNIVFSQVGGNGATNCAILCNINSMTQNVSACTPGSNTYSVTGNINVFAPPTTGSLIITSNCGAPPVVLAAPFSTVVPYQVVNLNSNGQPCSLTAAFSADTSCKFTINYNAPPACAPCTVAANNTGPYCENSTINLTSTNVTAATSFVWSGPNFFSSASQNPNISSSNVAMSGIYSVTVTVPTGTCTSSTNVTINPTPVIVAGSNSPICAGSNLTFSASGGAGYQWIGPNGFSSNSQNPVISQASPANGGVYTVTVTSSAGCSSIAFVNAGVGAIPVINASATSPVCEGDLITFEASGGQIYQWAGPNNFGASMSSATLIAEQNSNGLYNITVSDAIGCSNTAVIQVVVNPLPGPVITSSPNKGCVPLCVTFNCENTSIQNCNWNLGNGTPVAGSATAATCYNTAGTYSVSAEVTDMNGCVNTATYTVYPYPIPVADFVYNPLYPTIHDEVHFIDASHEATIASWNWYLKNDASEMSYDQNPSYLYTEVGNYVVALIVKSDFGCSDTIVKFVPVGEDFNLYIPNSFTPNEDGINDVFQPKGNGISKYTLEIFDRWGEKVFQTNDFLEGWDGKYMGRGTKLISEGTYVWKVKLINVFSESKEFTGHVTLMK